MFVMTDDLQCEIHGNEKVTCLCTHLTGDASGLGFHRTKPTPQGPFPDAWCDDCEIIRAAHDGWNEESDALTTFVLVCAACYEESRKRNARTGGRAAT
jgi:hypothetical protein